MRVLLVMRVFAFLDIESPPVAWAVTRGMLVSADQAMQGSENPFVSFMLSGIIRAQNNVRLHNELIIEKIRSVFSPKCTSRLQGMYFFASREDAEQRINDPNWPPYFQKENLVEFELYPSDIVTKVDSDWITYAPLLPSGELNKDVSNWITKYWSGIPYSETPVWEVICKGVALVVDEQIRRKCYRSILEQFPDVEFYLLMSRVASEAGSFGGLVAPAIIMGDNGDFQLSYWTENKSFHQRDVIQKMSKHPDAARIRELRSQSETFTIPDFREYGCNFTLTNKDAAVLGTALLSVHHS